VNAAEVQQVLEDRATALARAPTGQIEADAIELVVLQVGGERYGIDVRLVREVRPPVGLAPVPGTPEFWSGLVNLRGSLCPVLSLRRSPDCPTGELPLRSSSPPAPLPAPRPAGRVCWWW
jgi:chemotaxis signal transduction protein